MSELILSKLKEFLDASDVSYRLIEHAPTRTSEESAAARNEPLEVGAKALLLKADSDFLLFVLPAHRKIDSGAVKRYLGVKKIRFATPEELLNLAGLVPGSVPPFGEPILPFRLYADSAVGKEWGRVAFNAGSLTSSLIMSEEDWRRVAQPEQFELCQ